MNEDKIKAYIGQKVAALVENFFKTTPDLFNYQRNESAMEYDNYCWMTVWSHKSLNKFGFGFEFLRSPNRLGFYTVNSYGVRTGCFIWEYPNVLVDVFSRPHPIMIPSSFKMELLKYFEWEITKGDIQSEYKRFLASLHHQNEKIELNTRYGLVSMSPIDEEAKKFNILKRLSESLVMPIITSSQNMHGNKEENSMIIPDIKNVFFNEVKKTTTVLFNDHTSVVVKCTDNDEFDPEMGLAMALARRYFGSRTKLKKAVAKWVATSAPKNEQLKKKAARKAEKEAAQIEHLKAQFDSYME